MWLMEPDSPKNFTTPSIRCVLDGWPQILIALRPSVLITTGLVFDRKKDRAATW